VPSWRPIQRLSVIWTRRELRVARLNAALLFLGGATLWLFAPLVGVDMAVPEIESRLVRQASAMPPPWYFFARNALQCGVMMLGVFTFGLTAAWPLLMTGISLGRGIVAAVASDLPVRLLGASIAAHAVPEIIALIWAGSVGFTGLRGLGPLVRNEVVPVRIDGVRLRRAMIGVPVLLILAACLESWVTPRLVMWAG